MAVLAAGSAAAAPMQLGVNTHFDQGWPLATFEQLRESQAQGIRDVIRWGRVEQAPGRYVFTAENSGFAQRACHQGLSLLLTLTPRSKSYDGGETVYSPEGRQAFAGFVRAVADRFPCLAAVEIGNEINDHSLKGRMVQQMPQSYVAIIAATRAALKPGHPKVALLSGSSLSVATGFFERLFGAGLLPLVDGIVVHPYLATPEQLPGQLARLNAAMARSGTPKPVWASEFSYSYATPEAAPAHALKMITLMSAAQVARADWYALIEEKWFPNAGLFIGRRPQPVLESFRLARSRLLAAGQAKRIDMGDPLVFAYRFGAGPTILWGSDRPISWTGGAQGIMDARGQTIAPPKRLSDQPIIMPAGQDFSFGAPGVLADSLPGFAGPGWRYLAAPTRGQAVLLGWIDWNWEPYISAAQVPSFRAMPNGVSTAGRPNQPVELVERYSGNAAGDSWISACFNGSPGKPQQVTIVAGGKTLWSEKIAGLVRTPSLRVPQSKDRTANFEVRYQALTVGGPQLLSRRLQLLAEPNGGPALCTPRVERQAKPDQPA